ncbi:hypothetical protein LJR219_000201 [Phenylobacterium sp. LjRoot219]|uniref:hypothetical protein n=1 Tax=Phenylobacterium sp. LjRoot219 TaxID=3342283 RepID=UPI003ECFCF24
MFGLFRKRARVNPLDSVTLEMIRPTQPKDPFSFTDQETATINGTFLVIQALMREWGGEIAQKWDEAWAWFQAQGPDKAHAQCFMINRLYAGLDGEVFVSPGEGNHIVNQIGRTVAHMVPDVMNSRLAGLCQSVREAHHALLDRIEEADDALAAEADEPVPAP